MGQDRESYMYQLTWEKQWWMRGLVSYSGSMEGWTLSPPYPAAWSIRGGTRRPKETATIKFTGKP